MDKLVNQLLQDGSKVLRRHELMAGHDQGSQDSCHVPLVRGNILLEVRIKVQDQEPVRRVQSNTSQGDISDREK